MRRRRPARSRSRSTGGASNSRSRRARGSRTSCATRWASPEPRSAVTRATAVPAPCCWTTNRCAPAWSRSVSARVVVCAPSRGWPGSGSGRLQQAFVDHGAAQCGICTPGMLMAAQATLERYAKPTEAQVLDGIGGVLCRCTGYRKIVEAVLAAAGDEHEMAAHAAPAGRPRGRRPVAPARRRRQGDRDGALRRRRGAARIAVAARDPVALRARRIQHRRHPRVRRADRPERRADRGGHPQQPLRDLF